jgi:hypothetical protein
VAALCRLLYSFRRLLIAASSTTAFASIRMAVATTASSCAGVQTVALAGQTILTIAGRLSGSTSSTVNGSWLTSADARGVMG